jgi:hypothetical protein
MPKKLITAEATNKLPQATIRETDQAIRIRIIDNPLEVELALTGHLYYGEKQILAVKGTDTVAIILQVYAKFAAKHSVETPFTLSTKQRGLVHISPVWKAPAKVNGSDMLDYLNRWFAPAQLVSNPSGPALLLIDKIPVTFAGMVMQPRYVAIAISSNLFTVID